MALTPQCPLPQSCLALARPHLSWPLEHRKEKEPVSPLTGQGFGGQWAQVWPDPCSSLGVSLLPEERPCAPFWMADNMDKLDNVGARLQPGPMLGLQALRAPAQPEHSLPTHKGATWPDTQPGPFLNASLQTSTLIATGDGQGQDWAGRDWSSRSCPAPQPAP